MMGVGDWVVCVDDSPALGKAVPLIKGEYYQIAAIWGELPHGNGEVGLGALWTDVGLDLHGVPPVLPDIAYGAHRFRPIEPTRAPERALEVSA